MASSSARIRFGIGGAIAAWKRITIISTGSTREQETGVLNAVRTQLCPPLERDSAEDRLSSLALRYDSHQGAERGGRMQAEFQGRRHPSLRSLLLCDMDSYIKFANLSKNVNTLDGLRLGLHPQSD